MSEDVCHCPKCNSLPQFQPLPGKFLGKTCLHFNVHLHISGGQVSRAQHTNNIMWNSCRYRLHINKPTTCPVSYCLSKVRKQSILSHTRSYSNYSCTKQNHSSQGTNVPPHLAGLQFLGGYSPFHCCSSESEMERDLFGYKRGSANRYHHGFGA